MAGLIYPPSQNAVTKTLAAQLDEGHTAAATLNNTTNVQNKQGLFVVDRVDTDGNLKSASVREYIIFQGTSGATVTTLTRGVAGSTDQDHAVGAVVEFVADISQQQAIIDALLNMVDTTGAVDTTKVVTPTGTQTLTNKTLTSPAVNTPTITSPVINTGISGSAFLDEDNMASNSATKVASQQSIKAYVDTSVAAVSVPVKATGAEVTTGTDDAKFATPLALANADVNTRLKSKLVVISRDLSAGSGDVSTTGVGFTPTAMIAFGSVDGAVSKMTYGMVDSASTEKAFVQSVSADFYQQEGRFLNYVTAGGSEQYAVVKTFDADGFTLTWTKSGTPSGTFKAIILCFR